MMILDFKMVQARDEIVVLAGDWRSSAPDLHRRAQPAEGPATELDGIVGGTAGKAMTLVVETIGFKESAWLDAFGHPRSEAMRITERYRRRDFGHMDLDDDLGRSEVLHPAVRFQDHADSAPRHRACSSTSALRTRKENARASR